MAPGANASLLDLWGVAYRKVPDKTGRFRHPGALPGIGDRGHPGAGGHFRVSILRGTYFCYAL